MELFIPVQLVSLDFDWMRESKNSAQTAAASETQVKNAWILCKSTILSFLADEALSKGAAIAFYTVTSLVPILLIVVAIAGLAFGREAAQNGIIGQLSGLMGKESAEFLQSAIANAQNKSSGTLAALIGVVTLIVTASGVFGEMPAFGDQLSAEEIRQITYYLQVLRGERAPEPMPK